MFTYLYEVIFPYLGDCFGQLSIFATMSVDRFLDFLFGTGSLTYTNLFTGLTDTIFYVDWTGLLGSVQGLMSALLQPYLQLPVWVAMILLSMSGFFIIYFVKFLLR